jgi:hypothetical protein
MANRQFDQYNLTIQKRVVELFGVFSMSGTNPVLQKWNYPALSSGALARTYSAAPSTGGGTSFPTRYAQGCEGIFSCSRTAAGLWTLTLQDNYQRILGLRFDQGLAAGVAPNVVMMGENTSVTNMAAAGGSVIGLVFASATGVAADPTSGSIIRVAITLHDASEP